MEHIQSSNEILNLNESKEYTLLATSLTKHLLLDKNLSSTEKNIWIWFYQFAKLNEALEVNFPYSEIAENFGISRRTVERCIANLISNSYLKIKANKARGGRKSINSFFLCFPKSAINKIKQEPDRKSKYFCDKNVVPSADKNVGAYNNKIQENTNNNIVVNFLDDSDGRLAEPPQVSTYSSTENQDQTISEKEKTSKMQSSSQLKQEINDLESTKTKIEDKVNALYQKMNVTGDTTLFQQIQSLNHQVSSYEIKINQLKTKIKAQQHEQLLNNRLQNTDWLFKKLCKGAGLSPALPKHIKQKLSLLKIAKDKKSRLTNEILYAITQGSLRKTLDGQDMPANKGINIGFKLIRENRWQTPDGFLDLIRNAA